MASADTPVQLPVLPPGPAPIIPVAAGGEGWLSRIDEEIAEASRPPTTSEVPVAASGDRVVATIIVKEGDTLLRLARGVYGFASEAVLRRVVARNPGITDGNRILVGSAIHFPDVSDLQARQPGSTSREQ